jgi:hypothetical protein
VSHNLTPRQTERQCEWCGTTFVTKMCHVESGGGRFCSPRCVSFWREKQRRPPLAERFWAKVDKNAPGGCWLWTACRNQLGYGEFSVKNRSMWAHRVAWELVNGPIPNGLEICHNCPTGDNPSCVNPEHMFLGTHADNLRDAIKKQRSGLIQFASRNSEGKDA